MVKKSLKCSTWMKSQKWQNDLCSFPRQTIQYHTNSSLCPNQLCWRSWSWTVLWWYIRPFRSNTKKRCSLHHSRLECKSRKSRDTWSDKKVCLWSTEWSRAKANWVLPREHTGHSKHPLPKHKRRLYAWTSPDGQYQNQTDYILCSWRWRSSIQSAKTRLGADTGSDHELLIAKFRLKWRQ